MEGAGKASPRTGPSLQFARGGERLKGEREWVRWVVEASHVSAGKRRGAWGGVGEKESEKITFATIKMIKMTFVWFTWICVWTRSFAYK